MSEITKEQIADWLDEAAEEVQDWGAYASEIFQKKHDLAGAVKRWRDRADLIREDSNE